MIIQTVNSEPNSGVIPIVNKKKTLVLKGLFKSYVSTSPEHRKPVSSFLYCPLPTVKVIERLIFDLS